MPLELEIDVPESRQTTVDVPPPPKGISEKAQRERAAFYRMLPELLKTHYGKVVAIHNEQVIAVGDERRPVIDEARKIAGYVDMHIASVLEKQPVERLKGFREIGPVVHIASDADVATPQVVISTPVS